MSYGYEAAVAVSPDGRSLYFTNYFGAIAIFDRAVNSDIGALTQKPGAAGCISNDGLSIDFPSGAPGACVAGKAIYGAWALALSPDGENLYSAAEQDGQGAVAVFDREPVDTTPPDTTIDSGPSGTITTNEATFTFGGNPASDTAKIQCRIDGGAFADCTSPKTFTGLSDGPHTASFRAEDASGNQDQSPAARTFTVDTPAGLFRPATDFLDESYAPRTVISGDFDDDGNLDDLALLFRGAVLEGKRQTGVFFSYGDDRGGFSGGEFKELPLLSDPLLLNSDDFDGDGLVDLAVASWGSPSESAVATVSIALGADSYDFSKAIRIEVSRAIRTKTGWSGIPDSSVSGANPLNGKPVLTLVEQGLAAARLNGNGRGDFKVYAIFKCGSGNCLDILPDPGTVEDFNVEDFNADGILDEARSFRENVSIRLGDGSGGFEAAIVYPLPATTNTSIPTRIISEDLSLDGRPDIVAYGSFGVSVLLSSAARDSDNPLARPSTRGLNFGRRGAVLNSGVRTVTVRNGGGSDCRRTRESSAVTLATSRSPATTARACSSRAARAARFRYGRVPTAKILLGPSSGSTTTRPTRHSGSR